MANTAELYGSEHGITREMQDEFALRSQQKADAAYKQGRIQEELVPVPLRNAKGEATGESLTEDDHRRPQTTMEGLAKLKAAFGRNGTVTAGNASGIVDGLSLIHILTALIGQLADAEQDEAAISLARKLGQFQGKRGERRQFLAVMQEITSARQASPEMLEFLSELYNASNREADYCQTCLLYTSRCV